MEGKNEIKQSRRMSEITAGEDCGGSRNPPPLRKSRELIDASGVHLNQDTAANAQHYVPIHSVLSTKDMSFFVCVMTCTVPEGGLRCRLSFTKSVSKLSSWKILEATR